MQEISTTDMTHIRNIPFVSQPENCHLGGGFGGIGCANVVLTIEYTRRYEERRVVTVSAVLFTFYDDVIAVGRIFSTASNEQKRITQSFIQVSNSMANHF